MDWTKGGLKSDTYREQCLAKLKDHRSRGRVLMQDGAKIHWTLANREYIEKTLRMGVVDQWPPTQR